MKLTGLQRVVTGACVAMALGVQAQTEVIRHASANELVSRLSLDGADDFSRGFGHTSPPRTDHLCPGAVHAPAGQLQEGSGSRDLVVIPYAGDGAASVDLDVQFATGSDKLSASDRRLLDTLAQALLDPRLASARFAIAGHTDATGDERVNLELSCARAVAARRYLLSKGVPANRLTGYGFGSQRPVTTNAKESATNRRVEIRRAPDQP
jgi:OmpA-OmpF porin, OOP family